MLDSPGSAVNITLNSYIHHRKLYLILLSGPSSSNDEKRYPPDTFVLVHVVSRVSTERMRVFPTNPFPSCTLRGLFSQVQNKRLQSSACAESKISQNFSFRFPRLIYSFQLAGHLVGFILVGRVSEKPFIILELGAQKGRWVME